MVRMPTTEEIAAYQEVFASNYSMLQNVYCAVDGLKLHLEQFGDAVIHNMF